MSDPTPKASVPSETLSGAKKSAVLCMALGAEGAAKVLQSLSPEEVEAVSREIASHQTVRPEVLEAVVGEFHEVAKAVESVAGGGIEYAAQLLEQTYGGARAKSMLERIEEQLADTGLTRFKETAPEVLTNVLRGEHPQTVALILAHLDVRQSLGVIEKMEPELAADVLYRVARMEKISPDMLAVVEAALATKGDVSLSQEMTLSGGPASVAKVLNQASEEMEKELLDEIAARNTELAEKIRHLMFVFEDLLLLDNRGMQRLLREIDGKELALALKAASDELSQHILGNMSERAASALEEEMEFLGPVRAREVEAAHTRIIEAVRQLEDSGEVIISGRGGDDDIIA
jgi:flagellar motor switch protein FliG